MNRIILPVLVTAVAALSPAPTATAAPPGFPEIDAFAPVNPQDLPGGMATLAAGHRIDTGDAGCVVGEGGLVACIEPIQGHGFVVRPSGSWVF